MVGYHLRSARRRVTTAAAATAQRIADAPRATAAAQTGERWGGGIGGERGGGEGGGGVRSPRALGEVRCEVRVTERSVMADLRGRRSEE